MTTSCQLAPSRDPRHGRRRRRRYRRSVPCAALDLLNAVLRHWFVLDDPARYSRHRAVRAAHWVRVAVRMVLFGTAWFMVFSAFAWALRLNHQFAAAM